MIRTKKIAMFAIPMLAVLMIGSAIAPASAGVPDNNAAVIIEGGGCNLFDGNGNLVFVVDPDNNRVATGSSNDNGHTVCHASGLAPAPGPGPAKLSGFLCVVLDRDGNVSLTTNSRSNVTPDGESLLVCKFP